MDRLRMRQIGWILSICCIIFMLTACVEVETTMTSDHSITVPALFHS